MIANAQEKLARKGCDLIVANDVSAAAGVFGGDANEVHLVVARGRRILAAAGQIRGRGAARRAARRTAWPPEETP